MVGAVLDAVPVSDSVSFIDPVVPSEATVPLEPTAPPKTTVPSETTVPLKTSPSLSNTVPGRAATRAAGTDGVALIDGEDDGGGVTDGVGLLDDPGLAVTDGVGLLDAVADGLALRDGDAVGEAEMLGDGEGLGGGVVLGDGMMLLVGVTLGVGELLGVLLGVGVGFENWRGSGRFSKNGSPALYAHAEMIAVPFRMTSTRCFFPAFRKPSSGSWTTFFDAKNITSTFAGNAKSPHCLAFASKPKKAREPSAIVSGSSILARRAFETDTLWIVCRRSPGMNIPPLSRKEYSAVNGPGPVKFWHGDPSAKRLRCGTGSTAAR